MLPAKPSHYQRLQACRVELQRQTLATLIQTLLPGQTHTQAARIWGT